MVPGHRHPKPTRKKPYSKIDSLPFAPLMVSFQACHSVDVKHCRGSLETYTSLFRAGLHVS